jgi:hypothetical protein
MNTFLMNAHADELTEADRALEAESDRCDADDDYSDPDAAYERFLETRDDWESWRDDNREREIARACGR